MFWYPFKLDPVVLIWYLCPVSQYNDSGMNIYARPHAKKLKLHHCVVRRYRLFLRQNFCFTIVYIMKNIICLRHCWCQLYFFWKCINNLSCILPVVREKRPSFFGFCRKLARPKTQHSKDKESEHNEHKIFVHVSTGIVLQFFIHYTLFILLLH